MIEPAFVLDPCLSPARQITVLLEKVHQLQNLSNELQEKRVWWREETQKQRQYALELKAARERDRQSILQLQEKIQQVTNVDIKQLQEENNYLRNQLNEIVTARETSESINQSLQETLQLLGERYISMEEELTKSKEIQTNLQSHISTQAEHYHAIKTDYNKLFEDHTRTKNELGELNDVRERLYNCKKGLTKANATISQLEEELQKYKSNNKHFKYDNYKYREDNNKRMRIESHQQR